MAVQSRFVLQSFQMFGMHVLIQSVFNVFDLLKMLSLALSFQIFIGDPVESGPGDVHERISRRKRHDLSECSKSLPQLTSGFQIELSERVGQLIAQRVQFPTRTHLTQASICVVDPTLQVGGNGQLPIGRRSFAFQSGQSIHILVANSRFQFGLQFGQTMLFEQFDILRPRGIAGISRRQSPEYVDACGHRRVSQGGGSMPLQQAFNRRRHAVRIIQFRGQIIR